MNKMSLPNIPDINPDIILNKCQSINLLLSSIAMEEIALSHILNAEGEKLQHLIKKENISSNQLLKVNDQVNDLLKSVIKSQILLQIKLEEVNKIIDKNHCKQKEDCHEACSCSKEKYSPCNHYCICNQQKGSCNE